MTIDAPEAIRRLDFFPLSSGKIIPVNTQQSRSPARVSLLDAFRMRRLPHTHSLLVTLAVCQVVAMPFGFMGCVIGATRGVVALFIRHVTFPLTLEHPLTVPCAIGTLALAYGIDVCRTPCSII